MYHSVTSRPIMRQKRILTSEVSFSLGEKKVFYLKKFDDYANQSGYIL
jgi:hypothetical protein